MSMKSSIKTRPTWWDGLIAAAVVLAAVACGASLWGRGGDTLSAVISVDGAETERIALAGLAPQARSITAGGYTLQLQLTETEIWMAAADCPTQDCVRTGHVSRVGGSIVCLPARVSVVLEGRSDGGVDVVLG